MNRRIEGKSTKEIYYELEREREITREHIVKIYNYQKQMAQSMKSIRDMSLMLTFIFAICLVVISFL